MVDLHLETPLTESRKQVTVLFEVLGKDHFGQHHLCRTAIRGTKFEFQGQLPSDGTIFLAVDTLIQVDNGSILMQIGDEGRVYDRTQLQIQNGLESDRDVLGNRMFGKRFGASRFSDSFETRCQSYLATFGEQSFSWTNVARRHLQ